MLPESGSLGKLLVWKIDKPGCKGDSPAVVFLVCRERFMGGQSGLPLLIVQLGLFHFFLDSRLKVDTLGK